MYCISICIRPWGRFLFQLLGTPYEKMNSLQTICVFRSDAQAHNMNYFSEGVDEKITNNKDTHTYNTTI